MLVAHLRLTAMHYGIEISQSWIQRWWRLFVDLCYNMLAVETSRSGSRQLIIAVVFLVASCSGREDIVGLWLERHYNGVCRQFYGAQGLGCIYWIIQGEL